MKTDLLELLQKCTLKEQLFFKRLYSPKNLDLSLQEILKNLSSKDLKSARFKIENTLNKRKQKLKYRLTFRREEEHDNPRDYKEDKIVEILCWHRDLDIGDKSNIVSKDYGTLIKGNVYVYLDLLQKKKELLFYSPIYISQHSDIVLSLSPFLSGFDSGIIGYAIISLESLRKVDNCNYTTNFLKYILIKEVNQYIDFFNNSSNIWVFGIFENGECTYQSEYFYSEKECKKAGKDYRKNLYK